MRFDHFHLVLMVTHACNLRCDYCYAGYKFSRSMPAEIGRAAILRALRSTNEGGSLELGFFGGEPLLRAAAIADLINFAAERSRNSGIALRSGLTTNGTVATSAAWDLMRRHDVDLCVSHDGLPEIHDRHRRCGPMLTAMRAVDTITRLLAEGRDLRVVMTVRPDSGAALPLGIDWLYRCGVRRFDLSLDVWAKWDKAGLQALESGLRGAADVWRAHLPSIAVNWFDEKAGRLLGLPGEPSARCGFGNGEIAVAPSGSLYPCERLIGEDAVDNPMRMPGHALDGDDFCRPTPPIDSAAECAGCVARGHCGTSCRCSNYVRTGDIRRPDALLCFLDRVRVRETARVLKPLLAGDAIRLEETKSEPSAKDRDGLNSVARGTVQRAREKLDTVGKEHEIGDA
jgi:uncharacterized protein